MLDEKWYPIKERFENALYAFKDAIAEDERDLEDELTESLQNVLEQEVSILID